MNNYYTPEWKISYWSISVAILGVIIGLISYAQEKTLSRETITLIAIFVGLAFIDYHLKRIDQNEEDIKYLKIGYSHTKKYYELENRIKLLENKSKR